MYNMFLSAYFLTLLVKIIFLVLDFFLIVFLFFIFRQILSMNTIVENTNDALILKLGIFLLLMATLSLFLTAIVIL